MKRNMDLVRLIMLKLQDHEHGDAQSSLHIDNFSDEEINYHCFIMNEAGLIVATDTTSSCSLSPEAMPLRLTWNGHEFIENAQNEKVWAETKQAVSKLGDVSFTVWASVLSKVVMENLGLGS